MILNLGLDPYQKEYVCWFNSNDTLNHQDDDYYSDNLVSNVVIQRHDDHLIWSPKSHETRFLSSKWYSISMARR
jgi:hypothetical protein